MVMPFRRTHGFSLIELLICIGIITTGLIFIVDIFSSMLNASTKGADWSVATYIAAGQLDAIAADTNRLSYLCASGCATGAPTVNVANPLIYNAGANEPTSVASVNNATYYTTYTVTKLLAGQSPQLYDVDAQVQWYGPPPGAGGGAVTAAGYGKVSMHLSRLIYVH